MTIKANPTEKSQENEPSVRPSVQTGGETETIVGKGDEKNFMGGSSIPFLGIDSSSAAPRPINSQAKRTSRKELLVIEEKLSSRDRAVLEAVQKYRLMTSDQIARMFFPDCANKVSQGRQQQLLMKRLKEYGLVNSLERQIGGYGGGSAVSVWHITEAGHRLLTLNNTDHYRRKRFAEPTPARMAHTLAVTECAIQLMDICRYSVDLSLYSIDPEPTCWRRFNDGDGVSDLKPDMFLILNSQKFEDRWFIEVDRGSEHAPQVIGKCNAYLRYYYCGVEQAETSFFPFVMWIVKDAARRDYLKECVKKELEAQQQIFLFITEDDFEKTLRGFYDPKDLI